MNHHEFVVGALFQTATSTWRCTDVGTRTIVAIQVDGPGSPSDPSWLNGPPYAIVEHVFDENDMPGCSPI